MRSYLAGLIWNDEGVTALEYALIGALVFIVIVAAVRALSTKTSTQYDSIQQALP